MQKYWLTLDPASGDLRAGFRAGGDADPPDAAMLEAAVAARGWTSEALDAALVAGFLDRCREAAARAGAGALRQQTAVAGSTAGMAAVVQELEAIEVAAAQIGAALELAQEPDSGAASAAGESDVVEAVVGQVVDGSFELDITDDYMEVLLTLHPPKGGRPVALADVRTVLAQQGVVFGIRENDLLQMLEAGVGEAMLVAGGIAPSAGKPTCFESLLQASGTRSNVADENALVDYRAMGSLVLVTPGMRLMRRIPGTVGKEGINVLGRPAPAPPPDDTPYDEALTGIARDESDPEVLVAAIAGAPSFLANGVSVNPVVEVDAVNLSSGNIDFDGTLQVRGDVTTGMTVKVTGDVVVSGTVEAAHIDAGGNVVVKGGIVGVAEGTAGGSDAPARTAQVTARGSVQARFIGNAVVSAGKDVVVESEIRQSDVSAGDSVVVGKRGSSQGSINGGQIRALRSVQAVTLGTMAGVHTLIQVGVNPHAQAQKEALQRTRKRLTEEKAKLEQLLLFLRKHPERAANGIGDRALQTHGKLVNDLASVDARENKLAAEAVVTEGATIQATRKIFGGVDLQIANRREEVVEDLGSGTAKLVDGKVVIR
jgi:uncharacterized protein (DUF342 family)